MQTFELRVQSILQGISRLSSVRGPVEPGQTTRNGFGQSW